jgi:hypothetical protein
MIKIRNSDALKLALSTFEPVDSAITKNSPPCLGGVPRGMKGEVVTAKVKSI